VEEPAKDGDEDKKAPSKDWAAPELDKTFDENEFRSPNAAGEEPNDTDFNGAALE
jgi:hypothetical protein